MVAKAFRAMATRPARSGCARMRHGRVGQARPGRPASRPAAAAHRRSTKRRSRTAAKLLGKAKRILIVAGGGAQDASPEVTELSGMLQAPVLAYRRGRGVLDSRDPLSASRCRLAASCGAKPTSCSASARGCSTPMTQWGIDKDSKIMRIDADPEEPERVRKAGRRADRRRRADPARA